jgi:hypothetical protein
MYKLNRHPIFLMDAASDAAAKAAADAAAAAGGGNNGNGTGANAGKTYTQDELDKMFGARAEQAKRTAESALLTELGVPDLAAAKAKLKAAADAEAASLSDLEKARKEAADAKALVDSAKAEATKARAEAEESLLQAALTTRAVALGLDEGEIPTAWLTLRNDSALRAKITPKAGAAPGTFDGVDDVIKQMLKDHPKWAKTPTNKFNINGADRGGATEPSQQELIDRKRGQYAGTF